MGLTEDLEVWQGPGWATSAPVTTGPCGREEVGEVEEAVPKRP